MGDETKNEPALQDNAVELYRLLMENVKDFAIFLVETSGKIATWNTGAERILGYKAEEAIGKPFAIIFDSQDIVNGQPEHELSIAVEKGRSEDERWHVRKDGSRLWASGVITPLWDNGGKLRGYAKVMRDITDRKRAETELAEANRRKDEFLAMLAHELRNPLAPITNSVQIMRLDKSISQDHRRGVDIIERQVRQIVRLVDDLLDVSRITKGKITLNAERVELSAIVNHAVESVRPLIDFRRHELTVSLPSESVWLQADAARLQQVLGNILTNAAKYTEPGGRIWLTAEREGANVVLNVKDTGIGILPEMLPRIFEAFVQADRSIDRSQGGLGIGLTLAKTLVEMHHGKIEAISAGVGQGSEFVVRMPAIPEVKPLPQGAAPQSERQTCRSLRILIVDDNADTVESLAMLLRLYGHDVSTAQSGPEGLQSALSQIPEVILADLGLPGIDGYEVARRIREHTQAPLLVAMTGYGQPEDRQRSKDAGFDYHLVKPIDPEKLQDLMSRFGKQE